MLLRLRKTTTFPFSICPLDDRYFPKLKQLDSFFSEKALMQQRVRVECEWLKTLLGNSIMKVPKNVEAKTLLDQIDSVKKFSEEDFQLIKSIERETNHDIKAVEYFIKNKLHQLGFDSQVTEYVHFLCTSEDINNLSYALMMKTFQEDYFSPLLK